MNILLVGSLSVNPERFLPLLKAHNVFGIWESCAKWGRSLKIVGPYQEIHTITIDEIKNLHIDIIWNLISPWDGLHVSLELRKKYPNIPLVRQSQGGITPWWHKMGHERYFKTKIGNYDFQKFSRLLECSSGLMFNAEKYRDCLTKQGVAIKHKPYIITNGMAFNYNLIPKNIPKNISPRKNLHIALIGRRVHPPGIFIANKIHVHYHSTSPATKSFYTHKEKYLGDLSMMRRHPVSIQDIFNFKKQVWYSTFSKYDAGLMHFYSQTGKDVFDSIDINVPGRVNTYLMAGLPPIFNNRDSAIRDFLQDTDCFVAFKDEEDLISQLRDEKLLARLHENVLKVQYKFSMQYELTRVIPFFDSIIKGTA